MSLMILGGVWNRAHRHSPWVCNSFLEASSPSTGEVGGSDSGKAEAGPRKRHKVLGEANQDNPYCGDCQWENSGQVPFYMLST